MWHRQMIMWLNDKVKFEIFTLVAADDVEPYCGRRLHLVRVHHEWVVTGIHTTNIQTNSINDKIQEQPSLISTSDRHTSSVTLWLHLNTFAIRHLIVVHSSGILHLVVTFPVHVWEGYSSCPICLWQYRWLWYELLRMTISNHAKLYMLTSCCTVWELLREGHTHTKIYTLSRRSQHQYINHPPTQSHIDVGVA